MDTMKPCIVMVLLILVVFMFAGCTGTEDTNSQDAGNDVISDTQNEETNDENSESDGNLLEDDALKTETENIGNFYLFTKAIENDDLEICDIFSENQLEKDYCLFIYAVHNEKITICEDIITEDLSNYCKARIKKDTPLCSDIQDNRLRIYCQAYISKDKSKCNELAEGTDHSFFFRLEGHFIAGKYALMPTKNDCKFDLASESNDLELCKTLEEKDDCIFNIAVNTENYKTCLETEIDGIYGSCLNEVAKVTHSTKPCNEIFDEDDKDRDVLLRIWCMAGVAAETDDLSICSGMPNYVTFYTFFIPKIPASVCFTKVADILDDSQICSYVVEKVEIPDAAKELWGDYDYPRQRCLETCCDY